MELCDREEIEDKPYERNIQKNVMMPGMAKKRHLVVEQRMKDLAEYANTHYQIIGLKDVDPEQIKAELSASVEDGISVIARHMNYGLYRVEGKADCPKDALNICRMLSMQPEILARIEEAYKQ